ncbi:MAG: hypothetical protein DRP30_07345, partial [Thermotoga sp.]
MLLSLAVFVLIFLLNGCGGIVFNHPPIIDEINIAGDMLVGRPVTIVIIAHDPDNDTMQYSISIQKQGTAGWTQTNDTGMFNYTPTQEGTYTVQATVTDAKGGKAATSTEFYISEVNHPPTCTVDAPSNVVTGETFKSTVTGHDTDGNVVETWLEFNGNTSPHCNGSTCWYT